MKYKERRVETLLAAAAVILLVFLICLIPASLDDTKQAVIARAGAYAAWTVGGVIALTGVIALAINAALGAPLERLTRWIIVALGGMLLIDPGWGSAAGLAAIGAVLILRNLLAPAERASPKPPPSSPPPRPQPLDEDDLDVTEPISGEEPLPPL